MLKTFDKRWVIENTTIRSTIYYIAKALKWLFSKIFAGEDELWDIQSMVNYYDTILEVFKPRQLSFQTKRQKPLTYK